MELIVLNILVTTLNIAAIIAILLFMSKKERQMLTFYRTKIKPFMEKTERIEKMITNVPDTFNKIFIETPEKIEHGLYVKVHHLLNYIIHGKHYST